ncbi:hypothetical protein BAJUN_02680 [Bajunvirus bajun]|uniref:Putative DnaT-like domain-containing protein n=1 Tax=Brevundimonas phage vB_BgoS-Bajun TaxID=2948594 RepID=A0A9E7N519_9CAUD|nr:hypothetical protein BAJUN_02680 [Brevundimonas phage vB_BgoS-Bajun]
MAFSFVVETGMGDSDATSYVDVDFADDYVESNIHASDSWLALEEEDKQRLLVRSSRYIDRMVEWNGERVDGDSGLRWPRAGVYDMDGFVIHDDSIPRALKEAVCEFATYLMSDDWTAPQGSRGLKEIQVDVIELKFDDTFVRGSMPDFIMQLLEGLGVVKTGRRPAFKKIIRH